MNEVLLIGNGFNRLGEDNSWNKLLIELTAGLDGIILENKPFPLLFEQILMTKQAKTKGDIKAIENEMLDKVIKFSKKIKSSDILKEFTSLSNTILTTNYDYLIEQNISSENFENISISKEAMYSLYRVNQANKKKIWHIHGELNWKKSICLGYERYGANIQKVRNFILQGVTLNEKKENELKIDSLKRRLESNNFESRSWVDYFFMSDISIVGLGLDYHEMDLWWLLDYRVREKSKGIKRITNEIKYYCTDIEHQDDRMRVLKSLGVNTIPIQIEKQADGKLNYYKFYEDVLLDIQKRRKPIISS